MPINPKSYSSLLEITFQYKSDAPSNRLINYGGTLCAPDEAALGFSPFNYKSGEFGVISIYGVFPVETEEAIQVGDEVAIYRDGKIKVKTNLDIGVGRAIDSAPAGGFARIIISR